MLEPLTKCDNPTPPLPFQDEQLVKQYRDDTAKMRDQIKELQTR